MRGFDGNGEVIWPWCSESLYICLVLDSVFSVFLIFSNVEFENKVHLRKKKKFA